MYATAFAATSDARLKTKIRPAAASAARLASVQARQYEFTCEPGRLRYGVLAQDLIAAGVQDAVFEVDGVYAVDYNAITTLLLDRVNALEHRLQVRIACDHRVGASYKRGEQAEGQVALGVHGLAADVRLNQ